MSMEIKTLLTLLGAIAGYWCAKKLKLPAPAMLGSMIFVGITNIMFDFAYFPGYVRYFAQGISGAYIGMQVTRKDIKNSKKLMKPLLLLLVMFTLNTFFVGFVLHFFLNIELMTALLSCVAGGVSDISLIAMDMNADASMVALMQTSRLVGVLLVFPYWISWMTRNEQEEEITPFIIGEEDAVSWLDRVINTSNKRIIFTLMLSFVFAYLGAISKIPAASLVFPLFAVIAFNMISNVCRIPLTIKTIAQLFAGGIVGTSITRATFHQLGQLILPVVILLISFWIVNIAYGYICKKKGMLDLKSALFASSPGGATDMSLIAADLHADLTKIALIQILRAVYAVSIMPQLVILVCSFFS